MSYVSSVHILGHNSSLFVTRTCKNFNRDASLHRIGQVETVQHLAVLQRATIGIFQQVPATGKRRLQHTVIRPAKRVVGHQATIQVAGEPPGFLGVRVEAAHFVASHSNSTARGVGDKPGRGQLLAMHPELFLEL